MMKQQEMPILIVAAFIKRNNKYLAIKRAKNVEVGAWETPGGRVKFGERVEDALKREIKEELGLEIKIDKFLGWGEGLDCPAENDFKIHRFVLYFDCYTISGRLRYDSKEISDHKWVTLSEFKKLKPLSKPVQDFFNRSI